MSVEQFLEEYNANHGTDYTYAGGDSDGSSGGSGSSNGWSSDYAPGANNRKPQSFSDRLNRYSTASQAHFNNLNSRLSPDAKYTPEYASWGANARAKNQELWSELNQINGYVNSHRNEFDEDWLTHFDEVYKNQNEIYNDFDRGYQGYLNYWDDYSKQNVKTGADGKQYDMTDPTGSDGYLRSYFNAEQQAKDDLSAANKAGGALGWLGSWGTGMLPGASDGLGILDNMPGRSAGAQQIADAREAKRAAIDDRVQAQKTAEGYQRSEKSQQDFIDAALWYDEQYQSGISAEQIYLDAEAAYNSAKAAYNGAMSSLSAVNKVDRGISEDGFEVTDETLGTEDLKLNVEEKAKIFAEAERNFKYAQSIGRYAEAPIFEGMEGYDASIMADGAAKAQNIVEDVEAQKQHLVDTDGGDNTEMFRWQVSDNKALRKESVTEDEYNTWLWLLGSGKQVEADEYAQYVNGRYAAATRAERQAEVTEFFSRNIGNTDTDQMLEFGRNTAGFLYSSLVPIVTSPFEYMNNVGEYIGSGTISEKDYMSGSQLAQAITAAVSDTLNRTHGTLSDDLAVIGGKGWGDMYQIGISVAQSFATRALGFAVGGAVGRTLTGAAGAEIAKNVTIATSLAPFFFSAGSQGIYDALDKGMDPGKAVMLGTLNGMAEVAGEVFSADHFFEKVLTSTQLKHAMLNCLIQAGIEGSEEGVTTLLNSFADAAVNGDDRALRIALAENISKGMSYDEASKAAVKTWLNGIAYDMVSGTIAGFFGSAPMAVVQTTKNAAKNVTRYSGSVDLEHMVREAESIGNDDLTERARHLQQRESDGKFVSQTQAERLNEQIVQASNQTNEEYINAIDNRLQELGAEGDTHQLASVVDRMNRGGNISEEEAALISNNPDAYFQITRELAEKSGWAANVKRVDIARGRSIHNLDRSLQNDAHNNDLRNNESYKYKINKNATAEIEGKPATLTGLATNEDGELQAKFKGEDGTVHTMSIDEAIQLLPEQHATFLEQLKGLEEDAVGAFYAYDGNMNIGEYIANYDDIVNLVGANGISRDVMNQLRTFAGMSETQKELAWSQGNKKAQQIKSERAESFMNQVLGDYAEKARQLKEDGQDTIEFAMSFGAIMTMYGERTGATLEQALNDTEFRRDLTDEQVKKAYELGVERLGKGGSQRQVTKRNGKISLEGDGHSLHAVSQSKRIALQTSADYAYIEKMVKALGIDVVFFESEARGGKYIGENGRYVDGVIYLDVNAGMNYVDVGERMLLRTMAHELTHHFAAVDPEKYNQLKTYVTDFLRSSENVSFDDLVKSKLARDTEGTLTYAGAVDEVIADTCETMLKNSKAMETLAQQNPELHNSFMDFVRTFLRNILIKIRASDVGAKTLTENAEAEAAVQNLWDELFLSTANRSNSAEVTGEHEGVRGTIQHSYAGRNALQADFEALDHAVELAIQGVDIETIRKQTGWFAGVDGKWRFEIDDSKMRYNKQLASQVSEARLSDLIEHEELFNNYPFLLNTMVKFEKMAAGERGTFDGLNLILNENLRNAPEDTLIHELQHAIQRYEDFSPGSSVEYWEARVGEEYAARARVRDSVERIKNNERAFYRDMLRLEQMIPVVPRSDTGTENAEWTRFDKQCDIMFERYGEDKVYDFMDLMYQYTEDQKFPERSPLNLYIHTAGEIEARDVSARRTLTAEQRRNQTPARADSETVFAERTEVSHETEAAIRRGEAISPNQEVAFSLREDENFMDKAIAFNNSQNGAHIDPKVMEQARIARATIAEIFRDPARNLNLPEDKMGNTLITNSSYGGTEENTTVCIRSLAAQALMDRIGERIGRPLTVEETLLISQEIASMTDRPECFYCYVATDRRAYRAFLGSYIQQRDLALKNIKNGMEYNEAYEKFRGGRKDTKPMQNRFKMWTTTAAEDLITAKDLASVEALMTNIAELQAIPAKKRTAEQKLRLAQLKDAAAYAQSASWAKKIQGYTAYNGHILKMSQNKVKEFNSHYGLRMYSFSDFSAAFILENMQMVTDASAKGLKMLAYTKEAAFAKIFAPAGININVSVYASEVNGQILEDGMQGADWKEAIALREQFPNVGITLVATNDRIVEWGLNRPEVDVVIPYHLVRTGQEVADYFGFTNYTKESADGKLKLDEDQKRTHNSVYPTEHNNDLVQYVRALEQYKLTPRFERYIKGWKEFLAGEISEADFRAMNPNYMKLVNETRRTAGETQPVKPIFNTQAAIDAIDLMERQGGYGIAEVFGRFWEDNLEEATEDLAEKIQGKAQKSSRDNFERDKYYDRQIDQWENKPDGTRIKVGVLHENSALNKVGFPAEGMWFDVGKIKKNLEKHDDHLSKTILKEIPNVLNDPIAITEYKGPKGDIKNTVNVFGMLLPDGKTPVVVGVMMTKAANGTTIINKIRTIHAHGNAEISDNNILYLNEDKKRTRNWFQVCGNSVPLNGTQFGLIRSIAYEDGRSQPKKSSRDTSGRELSPEQQEFFKDSAIRDANGNLMVVYHGTNQGDFNEFDWNETQRADGGFYGRGHYFTSSKGMADIYGKRIIEGYLNIKNPFVWSEEVNSYKNYAISNVFSRNFAARINMARVFPKLFANQTMEYGVYNERTGDMEEKSIKWSELEAELEKTMGTLKPMIYGDDAVQWSYPGQFFDKAVGEMYSSMEEAEKHKFEAATQAFIDTHTGIAYYMTADDQTTWTQDYGSEISEALKAMGYDGAMQDRAGTEIVAFYSNQIKNVDNKTPTDSNDIRYSQRDNGKTDRELLLDALGTLNLTEEERKILERYKNRLEFYEKLDKQLKTEQEKLRRLQAVDRFSEATRNQREVVRKLQQKITNADKVLFQIEAAKPMRDVLNRERARARSEAKRAAKAKLDERTGVTKYRKNVEKKARVLSNMLINNTDREHVPEALKGPLAEFLSELDFSSNNSRAGRGSTRRDMSYAERMDKLRQIILKQQNYMQNPEDNPSGLEVFLDLPTGFAQTMQDHINSVNEILSHNTGVDTESPVFQMNSSQLQDLDFILTVLTTAIKTVNNFHEVAHFASVIEAARSSIGYISSLGNANPLAVGDLKMVENFLNWQNTLPYYAFKRFGEAGSERFTQLSKGWGKMAFNVRDIMEFTQNTYTDEEVKAWEKEVHNITIESTGAQIQMTTAQIMALRELANREQAMGHLMGGGMRIGNINTDNGKAIAQVKAQRLTLDDVLAITDLLTDRQKQVADDLQKFMSTMGQKWGNEVSMKRFGYRAFDEPHYFPIETDDNLRPNADPDRKANDLFRLLNISATKALTPNANNALVVSSIFDVFANNMSDMAKYNALALPILDLLKWYNFQDKKYINQPDGQRQIDVNSVQASVERAFGKQGQQYMLNFVKDLNGVREGGRGEEILSALAAKSKGVMVAANLRVAIQQPTSIVRACLQLDPKYLVQGATMKGGVSEAMKYSGLAVWKDLGYFDTNIARNMRDQIKHAESFSDKSLEKAMFFAEMGDKMTWGAIWNACKLEVKAQRHLSGEALMQATAERFDEVILSTQVIDSTISRSDLMRSKSKAIGELTSFRSEPTVTYNALLDVVSEFNMLRRQTNMAEARKKVFPKAVKTAGVFLMSAAATGLAAALVDAMRDDDDYETFWEKFWEHAIDNTKDNANPFKLLPLVSDLYEYFNGSQRSSLLWTSVDQGVKAYNIAKEMILLNSGALDKPTAVTNYGKMTTFGMLYNGALAISYLTGLPIGPSMREFKSLYNTLFVPMGAKKIRTYDPGAEKSIQYAFADGYLTEEEAQKYLLEEGIVTDSNKAYWMVQGWAHEEDKSWTKYEDLYNAVLSGDKDSIDAAIDVLLEHGIDEKSIRTKIASQVKKWYQPDDEGNRVIEDKAKAQKLLQEYGGYLAMEAKDAVQEWTCAVSSEEHIDYSEIGDLYISGELTLARAKQMLSLYGGLTSKEVDEKIKSWNYTIDTGRKFNDLQDAFIHKDISKSEAVHALVKYGGKTKEEAEEKVQQWQLAKDYGIKYGSSEYGIMEAYNRGEINFQTAQAIMVTYGGKTPEDAEKYAYQYDFYKQTGYKWAQRQEAYNSGKINDEQLAYWYFHADERSWESAGDYVEIAKWKRDIAGAENFNATALEKWEKWGDRLTNAGVSKELFAKVQDVCQHYEADKDDEHLTVEGSKYRKMAAYIDSLPIDRTSKTLLARSVMSKSNLGKYATW